MRFLVLGAGGLGAYFGARLQDGGADVRFLVRPARAARLAAGDLVVKAIDREIRVRPKTLLAGQVDGPYDVVLLTCKAYDLDSAIDAIAPAMGDGSAVVPVLNGVNHIDVLCERFGRARVLGGLTFLNAAVVADGTVLQTRLPRDTTAIGELDGPPSPRCAAIRDAFTRGGVSLTVSDSIVADLWNKFCTFCCLATVATLTRSRAGAIAASPAAPALVDQVVDECFQVAAAEGHAAAPQIRDVAQDVFRQRESRYGPSMLLDMEAGRTTEGEHTIVDMVRRAARHGIPVPVLTAAACNLQAYEAGRAAG